MTPTLPRTNAWSIFLSRTFLAIGSTVLPSFFLNAALQRISPQANATIGTLSPVATILLAYLILGETLSPMAWLGTALKSSQPRCRARWSSDRPMVRITGAAAVSGPLCATDVTLP